jgi:hypothetical protein
MLYGQTPSYIPPAQAFSAATAFAGVGLAMADAVKRYAKP